MLVQRRRSERMEIKPGVRDLTGKELDRIRAPRAVSSCEAAQSELPIPKEREPQASSVLCGKEQIRRFHVQPVEQSDADHRKQIERGERQLLSIDDAQPSRRYVGVRQSRKQIAIVAPLVGFAPL